jgi:hypothetical protein
MCILLLHCFFLFSSTGAVFLLCFVISIDSGIAQRVQYLLMKCARFYLTTEYLNIFLNIQKYVKINFELNIFNPK